MKRFLVILGMLVLGVGGLGIGLSQDAHAIKCDGISDKDVAAAAGCDTQATVGNVAVNIINVVLTLVGIVTVIVIIYGGIMYATSLGDAGKAAKAKNTIIFGVIGLVVSLLAFAIVNFISTSALQNVNNGVPTQTQTTTP